MIETKKKRKKKKLRERERENFRYIFENLREFYNLHNYLTVRQTRFMYIG